MEKTQWFDDWLTINIISSSSARPALHFWTRWLDGEEWWNKRKKVHSVVSMVDRGHRLFSCFQSLHTGAALCCWAKWEKVKVESFFTCSQLAGEKKKKKSEDKRGFVFRSVLTCVAVCEGVEVSWDVSSPEETHHLCLHISIGRLLKTQSTQIQVSRTEILGWRTHMHTHTKSMKQWWGNAVEQWSSQLPYSEETDGCVEFGCSSCVIPASSKPIDLDKTSACH